MRSDKLKNIAADTLHIIEQGYYINPQQQKIPVRDLISKAVENTQTYTPSMLDTMLDQYAAANNFTTQYEVENETTLDAVRRLAADGKENILCLNFASAKNPGGGFLNGASAQEESIARASGLYPCLCKDVTYYNHHRNLDSYLYSDHMIYSPGVPVFRQEDGVNMQHVQQVSIITSAAVNAGVVSQRTPEEIPQIEPVMRMRIEKVLALSAVHKHHVLVLGAWGCGVFKNDPEMIAALFHEALSGKFRGQFEHVVFAVKTKSEDMLSAFSKRFL